MKKLENKTVFITGGLSGIGKSCAVLAAKEGANIAIADLHPEKAADSINELKQLNPNTLILECDTSEHDQVKETIDKVIARFSTLDIALNSAGIGGKSYKVSKMPEDEWKKVLDINLNGVFNCMKHELIQMEIQKSGVIVNMASVMGKVGQAISSHYDASKHGVIGLTQSAALEYATGNIRINAICPGFVETPLLTKVGINRHLDVKQQIIDSHPMKRLGKAEEIAKAFLFLASDDSSFITGSALDIDGGFLAK